MGFIVNNPFGFSVTKQFGAATIDGDNVTNYEDTHWSNFTVDTSSATLNEDGKIKTRSDKGFKFTNKADSGKTLKIKLHDAAKSLSKIFILSPGDSVFRDGGYSTVVTIPAGASPPVVTTIPWMTGWRPTDADVEKKFSNPTTAPGIRHNYFIEVLPAVDIVDSSGNGTDDSDPDAVEKGPNYLLYGGGLVILLVGGIFASNMMKK